MSKGLEIRNNQICSLAAKLHVESQETIIKTQQAISLWFGTLLVCAPFAGTIVKAQQASDPRVADLVRAGEVRVALYLPQYTKDPVTGELRGWPIEVVRVLGERMGVKGVPIEHANPPLAIACLKAGDC